MATRFYVGGLYAGKDVSAAENALLLYGGFGAAGLIARGVRTLGGYAAGALFCGASGGDVCLFGGLRGVPRKAPSIKEQALSLKRLNNNKNTVTVQSGNKQTHFDLDGAAHKGVETQHKQYSYPNTNPKGETFFNKDRKTVESMTQQDIRTVRNILARRNGQ